MSTLPLRRSYHHGDLRDALVAAALAVLEEGGDPRALTLRETARRAGVSAMAPYRHFADKDALLAGVAAIGFERFAAALRAADDHPDPHEALIAQGVAYVAFAEGNPALFRLMFGASSPEPGGTLGAPPASATASFGILAARIAALCAPDKASDATLACWCAVHGLALLALDGRLRGYPEPPAVLAARMLRLIAIHP